MRCCSASSAARFLGQIKSVDDLVASAYGMTWTVALLAALRRVCIWGKYAIGSAVRAMNAAPLAPDGSPTPELQATSDRTKRVAVLGLVHRHLHLHDPHGFGL